MHKNCISRGLCIDFDCEIKIHIFFLKWSNHFDQLAYGIPINSSLLQNMQNVSTEYVILFSFKIFQTLVQKECKKKRRD